VRVAILFGSQARGTARPDSDADIAVDAPGVDMLSLGAALAQALEREVDVVPLEDASIPLLEHLVRDGIVVHEGWPSAPNLAGGFNRLRDEGVISAGTADALCRAVGLRNVVAHGYAGINPAMVHAAAVAGVRDLEAFAREVAQWIATGRGAAG
jgi:predicted nucleotidyltransferase